VSAPQLLEPGGVARGVFDGVLNVAMSEIILNEPRVSAPVGERKAAGVAQHVSMCQEGQGGGLTVCLQSQIDRGRVQRRPLLADKEALADRLHPSALFQPRAYGPEFIAAQGLSGR
jgi:hypothetical protein